MQFSNEILQEISNRINIAELIGEYVELKQSGSNYKGLCPFHTEKTPSFIVSQEKGIYKCFGCGESGNAIKFLYKYLNISFEEAVVTLANRCGVVLPSYSRQDNTIETKLRNLYNIAEIFYHYNLKNEKGVEAYKYFVSRKILPETIERFKLGYSPNKNLLLNEFKRRGIDLTLAKQSGLISYNKEHGQYYDFFRNRAMFPIKDFLGRTIAFGGRQLVKDDKTGKYINSLESEIYNKSQVLFGLSEALQEIRKTKEVFIVEGYLDVISLSQAGITNVVAPCGTALTKEQLELLKKHSNINTIYLLFDGDSAGQEAARKGIPLVLETGLDLRIISLPVPEDPDSLINSENGIEKFNQCKNNSYSFVEFMYKILQDRNSLNNPKEKSDAVKNMINTVLSIKDKSQHFFYLEDIGRIFKYPLAQLQDIYEQQANKKNNTIKNNNISDVLEVDNTKIQINEQIPNDLDLEVEEKDLIKFAVTNANNFKILYEQFNVTESNFFSSTGKLIYEILLEYRDSDNILQALELDDSVPDPVLNIVCRLFFDKEVISSKWKEFIEEEDKINVETTIKKTIARLRVKIIDREIKDISEIMKNDTENIISLLNQIKILQEERKEINDKILNYE